MKKAIILVLALILSGCTFGRCPISDKIIPNDEYLLTNSDFVAVIKITDVDHVEDRISLKSYLPKTYFNFEVEEMVYGDIVQDYLLAHRGGYVLGTFYGESNEPKKVFCTTEYNMYQVDSHYLVFISYELPYALKYIHLDGYEPSENSDSQNETVSKYIQLFTTNNQLIE